MPVSKKKTSVDSSVIRHKIRDAIQQKIFQGEYTTGSRLHQIQLAREFKVSQSVIRESLLELHGMGLVELKDQLGAFVSGMDSRKLQQAYEIREMMEGLAARLCCDRINREELRELEQMAEKMRNFPPSREDERAHLDRMFHKKLMQITRNDMLIRISESYEILGKFTRTRDTRTQSPDMHYSLLEPIRDNQPDEAERRMREHIRRGWETVEKGIEDGFPLQWVE
ncbi:MAG: GntR family transcriptional regulator [Phycisphaerae bacterium]|nr:GntR family transcriptional regulator [Phycisphaerae bacterium]